MGTRIFLLTVSVCVPTWGAGAADWSLEALISETATYDDNRGLKAVSAGAVYGLLTALSLDLMAKTPTCQFSLTTDLSYPYNTGPGAGVLTDQFQFGTAASLNKQVGDLTSFNLSASLTPESTRTTELTDSGEINVDATRVTRTLAGGVDHQINRRNSVSLSVSSTMVSFTGDSGDLVPFATKSVSGSWQHNLSRRTDFTGTLGYSHFTPDDPLTPASSTYSATAGVSSTLTRRLSASGSAGVRATPSEGAGTTLGWVGDLSVNYKRKNTDFTLSASRTASPSSLGVIQSTTSVGLNVDHAISNAANLSIAVTYSAFMSSVKERTAFVVAPVYSYAINDAAKLSVAMSYGAYTSSTIDPRQEFMFAPTYSYELTRHSHTEIGYKYKRRIGGTGDATSNTVFFKYSHDLEILH